MDAGYDPLFLGPAAPLPTPDRPTVRLDYPRFTVLLDPGRRLAAVTAVNIDGATLRDLPRTGDWEYDARVPAAQQAGPEVYASNDFDRGHLVRRRDPGWGDADRARIATEATFRYPNAAPQASGFNQSKQLWLGLEDHVLEYAQNTDQRLSVFTAPVLADDDPPYRGIRIPLRFWKIAAWLSPAGLTATGFILDQSELVDTRTGAITTPSLGGFRTFQVPIRRITEVTGLDWGSLADADAPRRQAVTAACPLQNPSDIVL